MTRQFNRIWGWLTRHADGLQVVLTLAAIASTITLSWVGYSVARKSNQILERQTELMSLTYDPTFDFRTVPARDQVADATDGTDLVVSITAILFTRCRLGFTLSYRLRGRIL